MQNCFFYRQSAAGTLIQPFVYGSGIESSRSVEGWKRKYHCSLNRSITLTGDPKVDSEIGTIFILNEMIFEAYHNPWHCAKASCCCKPKAAKSKSSPGVNSQMETGVYTHQLK